jgi:hypothetical protein
MASPWFSPAAGPVPAPLPLAERLLTEAHRELGARELAEVLLGVRRAVLPLLAGGQPPAPRPWLSAGGGLSPAARVYVRPIRVAVAIAAARLGPARSDEIRSLGADLERLVEDLAACPRGSAMPSR